MLLLKVVYRNNLRYIIYRMKAFFLIRSLNPPLFLNVGLEVFKNDYDRRGSKFFSINGGVSFNEVDVKIVELITVESKCFPFCLS